MAAVVLASTRTGRPIGLLALDPITASAGSRGSLLDLLDEAFEVGDLFPEGFLAGGCEIDPGPGAFPFIPLLDLHQVGLFQDRQVLPEVAGGQIEGGAQEAELHAPGL